jgi:hypothetical protein
MFEAEIDGCRRLTGGCGLARIDVADNDHVDVHLFLTAARRRVSQESIKIDLEVAMMLLIQCRWQIVVDSPHLDGIWILSVLCVVVCFLREKVESGQSKVSGDDPDDGFDGFDGFDGGDLLHRVIA